MSQYISISEPKPYQVIQRRDFKPEYSHYNNPGGPQLGNAKVSIKGIWHIATEARCEVRTVLLDDAFGMSVDWSTVEIEKKDEYFTTGVELPAGGWYRLELRAKDGNEVLFSTTVEPVGVGEVFIIAGQSYAENCNDNIYRVSDEQGRITAYDREGHNWRVADDPQPSVIEKNRREEKGTIWPCAMNLLLPFLGVPIGMINVALGATSSKQWLPGGELFRNLAEAGFVAVDFRYILWQQGESDVIEKTNTCVYKERIINIKRDLELEWGFSRCWVLAKSTMHPTVYVDPVHEWEIRRAIHELWQTPGFLIGPDTDILGGMNIHRADIDASGHFTALGQERAGMLWFSSIWNHLQKQKNRQYVLPG